MLPTNVKMQVFPHHGHRFSPSSKPRKNHNRRVQLLSPSTVLLIRTSSPSDQA